jgi:Cytochrome c oxidase subunit III
MPTARSSLYPDIFRLPLPHDRPAGAAHDHRGGSPLCYASVLLRTLLGSFSEIYHTPIQLTGLYWQFVDTVWVFLFAIFYIPGAHLR